MRGILLAGPAGERPVYDKPLVYYPLATLMQAGLREVLVVAGPDGAPGLRRLLGDGSHLGMRIDHAVQPRPDGVPQALTIGAGFVGTGKVALALGDNLLHGPGVGPALAAHVDLEGALIFAHRVREPREYGVVELDRDHRPLSVEEKPRRPRSDFAVPGLYFYDNSVLDVAGSLPRDARGRTDISAVNEVYRRLGRLRVSVLGPETAWLDTGTPDAMTTAAEYVRSVEVQQGYKVGCIEELAWRHGWIDDEGLLRLAHGRRRTRYGQYLSLLAGQRRDHTVLELPAPRTRAVRLG